MRTHYLLLLAFLLLSRAAAAQTLHECAKRGNLTCVKKWIAAGADLEVRNRDALPL